MTGEQDIAQALHIIITTPKGSDPTRPLFGCDVNTHIDKPENIAVPLMMTAIKQAVALWEPRIDLLKVSARRGELGQWLFALVWQIKEGVLKEPKSTEVSYAAAA